MRTFCIVLLLFLLYKPGEAVHQHQYETVGIQVC